MQYKKIDDNDLQILETIVDKSRLFSGSQIGDDYCHDEMSNVHYAPEVLVRVRNTEEISRIMRYAFEQHIPVVPRGAGTGLVGAAVAVYGGIMLDLSLMDRIIELDPVNMTVTVQPGVLLMDLTQFVEEKGFFYPPDPGEKAATIGGNISTNAGGMRAVKYGVTREYVRGMTMVLPSGKIIKVGGKTVKNSSGYSIKDLIVGSEGTLAVISEAVLRLLPKPDYSVSLLVPFADLDSALQTVPELVAGVTPTAVEFMERRTILYAEEYLGKKFPDTSSDYYLLLTYDGSSQMQLQAEYEDAAKLCLEHGADDVYLIDTEERKDSVWKARGAFLEAIKASTSEMDECDVVVPRDKLREFVLYISHVSQKTGIRIPGFGHAGDGNLHLYLCRDGLSEDNWVTQRDLAFDNLYAKAALLTGLVSGEHGIGYAKRVYLERQLEPEHISLMNGIKRVFDPTNILNPGKITGEVN